VYDKYGKPVPQFYYKVMMSGSEKMYYLYSEAITDPLKVSTDLTDVMDFARNTADNYSDPLLGLNNY
jgi:hypothetical protein